MKGPECRWCGKPTDAEFVDIGVGMQQVTGGMCWPELDGCGAYEMGPYQVGGMISEEEMATFWTRPLEDYAAYSPFSPEPEPEDGP